MKRLTHSDWAAISSALPALYSQRNLATLAFAWMRVAKELTAADLLITSELDTSSYAIKRPLAYPYDTQVAKLAPAFIELSAKVPQMIAGYSEGVLFGPATSR